MMKIRQTNKISTKLFIIISLFLIGFLTFMFLVQTSFFETYYMYKKTRGLRDGLNELKTVGMEREETLDQAMQDIIRLFPAFEQSHAASVAIGHIHEGALVVAPEQRTLIVRPLEDQANAESATRPATYSNATISHLLTVFHEWLNRAELYRKVVEGNETITFISEYADIRVLNAVSSLTGSDYVLLASTSLHPVGEAATIATDFYVYFLLIAVVLVIGLTYVFSRMISRPLVRLNKAASRMSQLDFTAECDVRSKDEIGHLGETLNFLSRNLRDTLEQLRAANAKLLEDIEKERKLEQLREQFVASVSHELKTPIGLIAGYAEGLRDGIVRGERQREYLDVIIEETERMEQIIMDMLDLSQLRTGHYQLRVENFRLDDLVASITDKMRREIEARNINCEIEMPRDEVIGDPFRISQVITNLMSNAIRYTPLAGTIRMSAHRTEAADGTAALRFELFNQGEPIPEDTLPNIWDAFYTDEPSHNRELAGSGIGLTVVRNILELHESSYGVRNTDDGVLFYFTLQRAPE